MCRLVVPVNRLPRNRSREPRHTPEQMAEHGFRDPRSRVLWKTGRVILRGADMTELRRKVYQRAGGRCEVMRRGKRCNRFAAWDGFGHGELSHDKHGASRNDTPETVLWSCRECHENRHPGPQFSAQRRRAQDSGAHPAGPA